jgi:hypothetical protein
LSGNSIGTAGIKAIAGVIDGKAKLKQVKIVRFSVEVFFAFSMWGS